ncbi:hypothetical protein K438DRAFT_1787359 [Mycena galopus ATCC 62051]|nr:hypothetical protein K438DRAFT_1787359 [Mycena galopus ATCC 62051]
MRRKAEGVGPRQVRCSQKQHLLYLKCSAHANETAGRTDNVDCEYPYVIFPVLRPRLPNVDINVNFSIAFRAANKRQVYLEFQWLCNAHLFEPSLAATAAPEILGQIFEQACGRYFGPDNVYRKESSSRLFFSVTKVIIRLVCRRWSEVARGTPGLWASSVIRPSESPESFEAWAPHVQNSSLQFHVILNSQEIEHSLRGRSVSVSHIVEFLSAKAAGCVMLSISTSEHNGYSEFLYGLNLAEFAALKSNAEGLDAVALPKLSSLRYKPSNNADLGDLMALLRNPRLQQLSVVIMSEDDINILIECSDSLANAHSLTVDGFHFDETYIRHFYRAMGTVKVLDVSTAVREFCTAIDPRSAFWQGVEKAHFRDARDGDLERLLHHDVRTTRLQFLGVQFTRYNLLSVDTEQFVSDEVDEVDFNFRTIQW